MNPREGMARMRAFVVDLCAAFVDQARAMARGVSRAAAWGRPRAAHAWARLRPRLAALYHGLAAGLSGARRRYVPALRRNLTGAATTCARIARASARRVRGPLVFALRTSTLAAALALVLLAAGKLGLHRVPVGAIGVRQVQWGGTGVVERDYPTGLHLSLLGRDRWYRLDAGTHRVSFAWENEGGDQEILSAATREGEGAQVAALVTYRIRDAWRLVQDGLREDYRARAVAVARRVLLEELARRTSAELMDPDARRATEGAVLARLEVELGEAHLAPVEVLLGTTFFNPTYEKKLMEKQLAAQDELTRASLEQRKAEQRANDELAYAIAREQKDLATTYEVRFQVLRAEHDATVADLQEAAQREADRARSELQVELLRWKNEGDLAVAAAEQERESLLARARNSAAGRLDVARRAAENLRIGRVVLDPSDPRTPSVLDLDELVQVLLGR